MKPVTIANCGGFWGDDPDAALRQIRSGPIDYLVMDYLAEVTMAILTKQKARDPERGYATDFLTLVREALGEIVDRGITVISNAGGVNPGAAGAAIAQVADQLGLADQVRVGVVLGDDLHPRLTQLVAGGEKLENLDTGQPFTEIAPRVLSANVYLGAGPVTAALGKGANIVVTGRVADAALALAAMVHEFGWAADDWDRLAAGMVAGHILECGLQATGGNFTDWQKVPSWEQMGFPIVHARPDGSFTVTKHPGTGGLVSVHTVTEQILYEIASPAYMTPDVVARFDTIRLTDVGPDRVEVSGVQGMPAPEKLKVSISYRDGFRAVGRYLISGPDAVAKAQLTADLFWESVGGRHAYQDTQTSIIGWDGAHPALTDAAPGEVVLQVVARHTDPEPLRDRFAPRVAPLVLGSVPGITLLDPARPRPVEVVSYWPCLVGREAVGATVTVGESRVTWEGARPPVRSPGPRSHSPGAVELTRDSPPAEGTASGETITVRLIKLCLGRSGDKGDIANVGVIARSPAVYDWMIQTLTSHFVAQRFAGFVFGEVERFELPNLLAVNFLLHQGLGGGGTRSLRVDPQGKTYAQYLLGTPVPVSREVLASVDGQ